MGSKASISSAEVSSNIQALKSYMKANKLEAFYVSSYDEFLNEYVPMINCHRFYVTGFVGSVAHVLVTLEGKVRLYVDGRYHEQADNEVNLSEIDVRKTPQNYSIGQHLLDDLKELNCSNIGCESDRTTLAMFEKMKAITDVVEFGNKELNEVINFQAMPALKPLQHLTSEVAGTSTENKLKEAIQNKKESFFVTAIDSLAWITNTRGYHLPNLSSFLGKGLVTHDKIFVFIDHEIKHSNNDSKIEYINCNGAQITDHLIKIQNDYKLENIFIDKNIINAQDFNMLVNVFGETALVERAGGLVEFHSIKTDGEMNAIRSAFKRSDKSIYETLKWVKASLSNKVKISERDIYNKTSECYAINGAVEQSFGTISGVGANGSIIHYSDPKDDIIVKEEDMILLDSGGYFEAGFATDTTRTFMAANTEGSKRHKEIYTLVLKGTLACQNAVFKKGTTGIQLDAITRQPLYQAGYDFAHGTGHGVGIHVHEGGVGIGPTRSYQMRAGQVVSIEPGIYIPGFGGVRIENIAQVIEHPEFENFLCFEPLVYIGYEPLLIDENMLSTQEKKWLSEYEAQCTKRGTSFLAG